MTIPKQNNRFYSRFIPGLFIIFAVHHRPTKGDKFCGSDLEDAQNTCWQPCSTNDDCCASSLTCYETGSSCGSSDLTGTNHYFCGVTWCDAAYTCGTPCPEQTECPEGQYCFADIPCNNSGDSAPPIPAPPTSAPYQFCGTSIGDAKGDCWQPCPRGDSDCCNGLSCFDTSTNAESGGTCANSDYSGSNHFFCGRSWCDAAYSCQAACPGGSSDECPGDSYCYADVPCTAGATPPPIDNISGGTTTFDSYCGTSPENAAENCWQPCRDNADCCAGQSCQAATSCPVFANNIGADHYFCGTDFCDATSFCHQPCPSGFDAECSDPSHRCFPNTPCNANVDQSANFLRYGLPENAMSLMRQYRLEEEGQTSSATSTTTNSLPIGIFFGISLICVVVMNFVWSRNTKSA